MNLTHPRSTALRAVAVAVAATVLAGCGSGSSDSTSGSATAPIKLMVDTSLTSTAGQGGVSFPWPAAGAQAAAKAINAAGGIDGRKLEIQVCDNKGDPNTSAQCGRTAQQDKVTAVVGSFDGFGAAQVLPVLQAAKIPYIGGLPASAAELQSPISFQFDPGAVLGGYALGQLILDSGCKSVTILTPGIPSAEITLKGQKAFLTSKGVAVTSVPVPNAAADVTPTVSSALAKHADCLSFSGQGQLTSQILASARKQGFTGKFITAMASLLPQFLRSMGSAANGVMVNSSVLPPTSDDLMTTQFRTEMAAYLGNDQAKLAQNLNQFAQDGWSSVQLVKQAFTGSSTLTSAYLIKKIPTMCDVNVGNVYPKVDFCTSKGNSTLPRVYNNQWRYFTAKNGQYVEVDSKWHDASDTVSS